MLELHKKAKHGDRVSVSAFPPLQIGACWRRWAAPWIDWNGLYAHPIRHSCDAYRVSNMNGPFSSGAGAVRSADIAVPERDKEVRFHSRVLNTGENPLWREEDLMNNIGMPIIGLGVRRAEYSHLLLQWMPHIEGRRCGGERAVCARSGRRYAHACQGRRWEEPVGGHLLAFYRDPGVIRPRLRRRG